MLSCTKLARKPSPMKYKISQMLLLLTVILGCTGARVKTHHDPEFNFRNYHNFAWVEVPKKQFEHITDQRRLLLNIDAHVREAVTEELGKKGFTLSEESPDFLIAYHTGVQDKLKVQDWGYAYARSSRYWGGRDDIELTYYRQGTLILDFVDAATKELSWRGVARKTLESGEPDEQTVRANLRAAVKRIIEKFPPKR